MSTRTVERALVELNTPQIVHHVQGGIQKKPTGPYAPPFLYPDPNDWARGVRQAYNGTHAQGDVVGHPVYGSYGQAIDPQTLADIEMIAPSAAKLIAGMGSEEAIAALRGKITQLQPYRKLPVIGGIARAKIGEYRGRIKALEKQAGADRYKRKVLSVTYTMGALSLTALTIVIAGKAYQLFKNRG